MAVVDPISGPTAVWTVQSYSALCSMFNPAPSRVRSLIGLQRSERRGSSAAAWRLLKARLQSLPFRAMDPPQKRRRAAGPDWRFPHSGANIQLVDFND